MRASALLSDGTSMDVTWVVAWSSSQPAVASVDSFGQITALSVGSSMIESGRAETVLVIGADVLSRFTDFDDKRTAALFGDGAGAIVLGNPEGGGVGPFVFGNDA